ncbi:BRO-N domain-containing protein [Roseococcus pinisoli]|uniref:Bro-N domain-containing protein n=1 Tax=Roseococcus pinisoli TaxID=2835040 RepID=A0ABS5QC07_9PROT|nr:BRO family protein [Roseococcus pinisoli]MBS7811231.1 hypothetical protein [Roseococcus pinisoli]
MSTSNSLFVFPETGAKVRVVEIEGSPWFVHADACRATGLRPGTDGSFRHHAKRIADDEKRQEMVDDLPVGSPDGGVVMARRMWLLSEGGLYKLILRARPERSDAVRKFQDWVTRDVLPAIRKDGVYVRGEELLKDPVAHGLDLNDLDALRTQKTAALEQQLDAARTAVIAERDQRIAAENQVRVLEGTLLLTKQRLEETEQQVAGSAAVAARADHLSLSAFARTLFDWPGTRSRSSRWLTYP